MYNHFPLIRFFRWVLTKRHPKGIERCFWGAVMGMDMRVVTNY